MQIYVKEKNDAPSLLFMSMSSQLLQMLKFKDSLGNLVSLKNNRARCVTQQQNLCLGCVTSWAPSLVTTTRKNRIIAKVKNPQPAENKGRGYREINFSDGVASKCVTPGRQGCLWMELYRHVAAVVDDFTDVFIVWFAIFNFIVLHQCS